MKAMLLFLRRFSGDASGWSAMEYAFLLMLVAAVAGFGMLALGNSLSEFFTGYGEAATVSNVPGGREITGWKPNAP